MLHPTYPPVEDMVGIWHRALTQRSISPPLIHVYVSMRLISTPRHQLGEVGCNVDSCIIMNKKANVLRTAGHCISHIPSVHNKGREHWTSSILHVLCVYKVTWLWCMRTWPRQRPGKTLFLLTMKNGCQFSKIFSNILPECSLLVSSCFFPCTALIIQALANHTPDYTIQFKRSD